MIGVLKTILGSGDVLSKGMNIIDGLYTSDTEKTQNKINLMKAYAPFKIAQRVLAIMFTSVFLTCFLISLGYVLHAYSTGQMDGATDIPVIVTAITSLIHSFKLDWIMTSIVLFYFGAGMAEGIIERRTEREQVKQSGGRIEPPPGR